MKKIKILVALILVLFAVNTYSVQAGSIFKTYQIIDALDDAAENKVTGQVDANASWDIKIYLGANSTGEGQIAGFRFQNVDIPDGATIKSAYLRFFNRPPYDSNGAIDLTITGEANASPVAFTEDNYNISNEISRPRTTATVTWSPEDWGDENDLDFRSADKHKSVDITPIVNEIISSGWTSGQPMVFFIEDEADTGYRRAVYTYDYTVTNPDLYRMARLTIEYEAVEPTCDNAPTILTGGSYLPDYSYAGYKWGEEEIPTYTESTPDITFVDITDVPYNVIPGTTSAADTTTAINTAISDHQSTVGTVVLHFPAGTYDISDIIGIERSDFVIQGEGSGVDGTIFNIDIPLSDPTVTKSVDTQDLEDEWTSGTWPNEGGIPYSLYTYNGGFFYTRFSHDGNRYAKPTLANVTSANQGDTTFTVDDSSSLSTGQVVNFEWENDSSVAFADYFVDGDCVALGHGDFCDPDVNFTSQPVTITAVDGNTITIKEPLLHDILPSARVRGSFLIENVGFENFSIDFPDDTVYGGHHLEDGYNGIYLADINNSWVSNVSIDNADTGILVDFGKNTTLQNISTTGRATREAHYNVYVGRSYGILTKDFNFMVPALHDPSFNAESSLTVYTDGYLYEAKMDQHKGQNNSNLADNLIVGYTPNLFEHGGNDSTLLNAGPNNTFWNIKVGEVPYNSLIGEMDYAPNANLVGIYSPGNTVTVDYTPTPYTENLNQCVNVPSLYESLLEDRGLLDITSPTISEVTPVSTPTNDNTPDYTFTTDEAGTITYGGTCSSVTTSAVVGNNTITFNTLSDGTYSDCTITVTDSSTNVSNVLSVTSFVVNVSSGTVPDPFTFTDTTSATLATLYTSNSITVSGISVATTIEITAGTGEYEINNSGTWTNVSGTVDNGDTVKVRQNSSSSYDTTTDLTLSIGGVTDTYSVTSESDTTPPTISEVTPVSTPTNDNTPDYTFTTDEAGTITYGGGCSSATTSAVVGNNTITFNTLSDGTYSDCTITVTDSSTNVSNVLSVTSFVVDTFVVDTVPDPFAFTDVTGAIISTAYTSNAVTVTGVNSSTSISIVNGEYRINSGSWMNVSGTVNLNDTVEVRQTSSTLYSAETITTLNIGGIADDFNVVTESMLIDSVDPVETVDPVESVEPIDSNDDWDGSIGNTIWNDKNGNGKEDKNEKGIENIRVKLIWEGEDGKFDTDDDEVWRTDTNHNGHYEFKDLPAGDFKVIVKEEDLAGWIQTYDPSKSKNMNNQFSLELNENENCTKADFGYMRELLENSYQANSGLETPTQSLEIQNVEEDVRNEIIVEEKEDKVEQDDNLSSEFNKDEDMTNLDSLFDNSDSDKTKKDNKINELNGSGVQSDEFNDGEKEGGWFKYSMWFLFFLIILILIILYLKRNKNKVNYTRR